MSDLVSCTQKEIQHSQARESWLQPVSTLVAHNLKDEQFPVAVNEGQGFEKDKKDKFFQLARYPPTNDGYIR